MATLQLRNPHFNPVKGIKNSKVASQTRASSLTASCKGEGSTQKPPPCQQPCSTGRGTRRFPEAAADKVGLEGAEMPATSALKRGWFPGASLGPCAGRNTRRLGRRLGARPTHVFSGAQYQFQRAGLSLKDLHSREIAFPFLLQLGNVGTNTLLTFPRLPSQRGDKQPNLSWSADQSL